MRKSASHYKMYAKRSGKTAYPFNSGCITKQDLELEKLSPSKKSPRIERLPIRPRYL
ncbi:hypothetical protein GIB67_021628, partial [Kingdonia uniflora]